MSAVEYGDGEGGAGNKTPGRIPAIRLSLHRAVVQGRTGLAVVSRGAVSPASFVPREAGLSRRSGVGGVWMCQAVAPSRFELVAVLNSARGLRRGGNHRRGGICGVFRFAVKGSGQDAKPGRAALGGGAEGG